MKLAFPEQLEEAGMIREMRRRAFLVASGQAILFAPLCPSAAGGGAGHSSGEPLKDLHAHLVPELERRIPSLMKKASLPGLAIAIVRDSKLTWCRGFGVADVASGRPVDCATIFEAQSLSKPVFAYLVLKLCETGVLDLDTPLTRYTSDRILAGDPRLDRITARHVLSHTGGLQNWRSNTDPLRIHFDPGEQWLYSGEAYSYLQSVVTHLIGRTDPSRCVTYDVKICATDFVDYMKARLLIPFGMTSSDYIWNVDLGTRSALPHDVDGKATPGHRWTAIEAARWGSSGGLLTTPADYARFLIAVMSPRPNDTYRLNRDSLAEMVRPAIRVPDKERPSAWSLGSSWGLGWQLFDVAGDPVIAHGGDSSGFHNFAAASLARKSALVVMTNGQGGSQVIEQLVVPDFLDRLLHWT
ncbi:serine hydrolase domain-containing protein [Sphingomonas sp. DT-204]|uniref:serine hydrolase domain-containing protein n=1 Tax=Sphingomonas sp. DT-204 TaxID=3396166 RepID=UPI003F19BD66